jgi:hypothetical protein
MKPVYLLHFRGRKHYPKIHVWGCFSSKGFGRIILFRENLKSKKLIDIYDKGLLPSAKEFKINSWVLLEDNDSKHTSKLANSWREENQIDRISWPSNSPDINPIENIWAVLKNQVAQLNPRKMPQNLVLSMPERITQVIQSKGDAIDY